METDKAALLVLRVCRRLCGQPPQCQLAAFVRFLESSQWVNRDSDRRGKENLFSQSSALMSPSPMSLSHCRSPFTPISQFSVIYHMLISPATEVKHFCLSATTVMMSQQKSCFSVSPAQQWCISKWSNNVFGMSAYCLQANCFCFYFGRILLPGNLKQLSTEPLIAGKTGAGD